MSESSLEHTAAPSAKMQEELEEGEIQASRTPSAPSATPSDRADAPQASEKVPFVGALAARPLQPTVSVPVKALAPVLVLHEHEEPHQGAGDAVHESDSPDDSRHVSLFAQPPAEKIQERALWA